ncbi:MAG: hypothetical protein COB54_06915 [Alphaproteobacteria bacterium]|nr:MAG: hypothetical protein COB54_06915 [Alphaproteobacteria bacterium]
MTEKKTAKAGDGRRARSARSRGAILKAMIELIAEGILVPTAQSVSDRAGVGIRTVFRHFDDMESLFSLVTEEIYIESTPLIIGGDRTGSLEIRVHHGVDCRIQVYEKHQNILLSGRSQRWEYKILRDMYAGLQKNLRADFDHLVPELKELSVVDREAVDASVSFEMWRRLTELQGLDAATTRQVMIKMVSVVIPLN